MKKKILILTSYVTGHGHKSITNSIEEALNKRTDIEYKSVEAFELGGKAGVKIGKLYAPIIRNSEDMWKFIFKLSAKQPDSVRATVREIIKNKFYKLIDEYQPDLIVSVHPAFTSAIIDLLNRRKLKIPFAIILADLISISPLWVDHRANLIIAPTKEASICAQKRGVNEDKIKILNLPVRKEITEAAKKITSVNEEEIAKKKNIDFLLMSGGEGSGDMGSIVEKLLRIENSRISVIAGRNSKLKEVLEVKFQNNLDRVTIYGFVKDVENLMLTHDVGIVRGSPNVLMECITCTLPVILTGTLPGQEEGNIDFILGNRLGLLWHKKHGFINTVDKLLRNDRQRLIEIKKNQLEFRDLIAAEKIVDEFVRLLEGKK